MAQFDSGFQQWKVTSLKVVQLATSDPEAASVLSFGDSESQFQNMRDAIDKLGELEDNAANAEGQRAIAIGETRSWQQG